MGVDAIEHAIKVSVASSEGVSVEQRRRAARVAARHARDRDELEEFLAMLGLVRATGSVDLPSLTR